MKVEEVEAILGGSGITNEAFLKHVKDLEKHDNVPFGDFLAEPGDAMFSDDRRYWVGQRGYLSIDFDPHGHVLWKFFQE
jgi:hypothetical protein